MEPQRQYISKRDAGKIREKKSVVVDREIKKLYEANGNVTPEALLEAGRKADSPLHQFFEWDDTKAAEKYRLQQAYSMIQASKFVTFLSEARQEPPKVAETIEVRALLPTLDRGHFKMRNEVLSEGDSRQLLIERKISVLRSWCKSTVDIDELKELRDVIEKAASKFAA